VTDETQTTETQPTHEELRARYEQRRREYTDAWLAAAEQRQDAPAT